MKQNQKHHLINWKSGKTICGVDFKKDSIRFAELDKDDNNWYNDFGDQLNTENWDSVFCLNCLKLHESNLIERFKLNTFMVRYELELPKTKRSMKKKKSSIRLNRVKGIKVDSITDQLAKEEKAKSNPIPKTAKGLARQAKKQSKPKAKPIVKNSFTDKVMNLYQLPTESKCKVVSKPKPKSNSKPKRKPLIDLSNGPVIIKTEELNPIAGDNWVIGEPIVDNTVSELEINPNWKMVRHDKKLDMWKLQFKSKKTQNKWIDDCEFIPYETISEIVNGGYCS